jgi:hypothetical protein
LGKKNNQITGPVEIFFFKRIYRKRKMSKLQYGFSACTWGEQNAATLIEPRG